MPNVSIIIPVYNKAEWLANTIDSILLQVYTDYEVIIINDGSTDNSLEIIKEYQKRDRRILGVDISNGGVSNARNVGLKYAKGKWIQFLDGDDLIDSGYLNFCMAQAEYGEADIIFSNFQMIDTKGKFIKKIECSYQGSADQEMLSNLFMEQQYHTGYFGYISNKLLKKDLIEKSKASFKQELKLAEDLDFYSQIYPFVGKAIFLQINSFFYLQTETNYLNNSTIDYDSQLTVQLDIREWFIKNGQYHRYKHILDKKVADYVFFCLFYTFEEGKSVKQEYERIINRKEVVQCIDLKSFTGFPRLILWGVKKSKYSMLIFLLNVRKVIRWIYRSI